MPTAKYYNQSQKVRDRDARSNPDFWEVPVEQEILHQFPREAGPYYETAEERQAQEQKHKRTADLIGPLCELIAETLTEKQRQIVRLYFFEGKTEYEIAEQLDISAPSVSQHLFGKKRSGKIVGGAIPKLRKHLTQIAQQKPAQKP